MENNLMGLLMTSVSLGYFDLPKCASTSIKNTLHLEEFGFPFEDRKCSADSGGLQHIHDYFHRRFSGDISSAEHRIIVVRDPVERFLSAYASRVTGHLELSESKVAQRRDPSLGVQAEEVNFIFNPGIGQFLENLDEYFKERPIEWHFSLLAERLPQGLEQFSHVHFIKRLDLLEAHLSEIYGKQIVLPRLQTMGQHLSVKQLSSGQLEQIIDFCRSDYELLSAWFSPDEVWKNWKSGQYAWVYQSAARRFEETLRLSRTPAELLIGGLEGKKISYVSSGEKLERTPHLHMLDRALLKGKAQVEYLALAGEGDHEPSEYLTVEKRRWKMLVAETKSSVLKVWHHMRHLRLEFAKEEPDLVHCDGLRNAALVRLALARRSSKARIVVELSPSIENPLVSPHSLSNRIRQAMIKFVCSGRNMLPIFQLRSEQDRAFYLAFRARHAGEAYCIPIIDESKHHLASIDSSYHGVILFNATYLNADEISHASELINEIIIGLDDSSAWSNMKILLPRFEAERSSLLKNGIEPHLNSERIKIVTETASLQSEVQASQVVVIPSLRSMDARQFVLEAQQTGRPVIAPNDRFGRMLVKDGLSGFLYSKKENYLAAEKIRRLISTRGLPEKMGFKGRVHVESQFTGGRVFEVMIEHYQSLLQ